MRVAHTRSAKLPIAVVTMPAAAPESLLRSALDQSGFWSSLQTRAHERGRLPAELRIAIKPDLDFFAPNEPTGTDPRLVEALIGLLRSAGYGAVTVIDGRNQPDGWLHNRGALCVPDLVGYRFEAADGVPYEISSAEDACECVPLNACDDGGSLLVASAWTDADFRISFAKNKTDEASAYALCVHNLLGLIPSSAAASRWTPAERCVHLLRRAAPDFALLDAVVSAHGSCGSRRPAAIQTDSLIASPSAVLVDWIGALKMGVDPHVSPVNHAVLTTIGLQARWTLRGDAGPWPHWQNPSPTVLHNVQRRRAWEEMDLLARAVLQPVDRERFPFRSLVVDQLNATVTSHLSSISDRRLRGTIEGLLHQVLALAAGAHRAYVSAANKAAVIRSNAPVMQDVDALRPTDFDVTERMVQESADALLGAASDARGFRIRAIDGHIHFSATRALPFRFDEFVRRVDITRSIQYMNDYVGGQTLVVARDRDGRVTRQIERNVYLPQPNWISVFGGQVIDVEKLERVRYGKTRQTIWWRTIRSMNASAESDDGSVSFVRNGLGEVDVSIFARQRFTQPRAVAAVGVERFRGVYSELVADAYAQFFDGTIANMKAACEATPFRIGREGCASNGAELTSGRGLSSMLAAAGALISQIAGVAPAAGVSGGVGALGERPTMPIETDDLGFRHFVGSVEPHFAIATGDSSIDSTNGDRELTARVFLVELGQAIARDMAGMAAVRA